MTDTTITITFGDQAENHVGMQKLGQMATQGFTLADIQQAKNLFEASGYVCEFIKLHKAIPNPAEKAAVLIVRGGADCLLEDWDANSDDMLFEQQLMEWDSKAKMYGKVVNKHARYNLCYGDVGQEPDYPNGLGRIIKFDGVPCTKIIRNKLPEYFGAKAADLVAEGNMYYDISRCGIGFHGDSERKKVIAVRLGASMPLHYQWFYRNNPVGSRIKLELNNGDLYAMSEKAVGTDWKQSSIFTLRHAAGCQKYLTIKN